MGLSPIHIIILLLVVVLLFGAGRVSTLMGDVAKGIKSFKKGMNEEDEPAAPAPPARRIATEQPLDAHPIPAPSPAEPAAATPASPVSTPDPDRQA